MAFDAKAALEEISAHEKRFNLLYRKAAATFGLPDAAMWVLYFLVFTDDVTQQSVAERMLLPKQTVNSATAKLAEQGLVELERIPGSRGKRVVLTRKGVEFAEHTVCRMLAAERRAVEHLGEKDAERYIALYGKFYECMRDEFEGAGIA